MNPPASFRDGLNRKDANRDGFTREPENAGTGNGFRPNHGSASHERPPDLGRSMGAVRIPARTRAIAGRAGSRCCYFSPIEIFSTRGWLQNVGSAHLRGYPTVLITRHPFRNRRNMVIHFRIEVYWVDHRLIGLKVGMKRYRPRAHRDSLQDGWCPGKTHLEGIKPVHPLRTLPSLAWPIKGQS